MRRSGSVEAGNRRQAAGVPIAVSELGDFRRRKEEFFRSDPQSPLTEEQRGQFASLDYFDENVELVIEAPLNNEVDPEPIEMQTSTGGRQVFRRAGVVRFEVDGEPAQLTLYASDDIDELFLPFRDATSGAETYGAGRYLDVDPPKDGRLKVDFNLAYNPYCAYNPNFSCPIPPGENWLGVPIRAGEKSFRGKGLLGPRGADVGDPTGLIGP